VRKVVKKVVKKVFKKVFNKNKDFFLTRGHILSPDGEKEEEEEE
jgi:hypothetical protein